MNDTQLTAGKNEPRIIRKNMQEPVFMCVPIKNAENFTYSIPETDGGMAVICFTGELSLAIDDHRVSLKPGNLCMFHTKSMVSLISHSEDFEGYLTYIDPYFFPNIDANLATTFFLYSRDKPVVSFPETQLDTMRTLMEIVTQRSFRKNHPFQKEIIQHVVMIGIYEICAVYEKQQRGRSLRSNSSGKKLRDQELFKEFLTLVEIHCAHQRALKFYADKLALTPKYLSSSIKRLSGKSGTEWINSILLQSIKSKLLTTHMTVQQISCEMNFPNPSFFGKYFKKHTGMTPREFKLRNLNR